MIALVASLVGSCTHGNPKFHSGESGRLAQGGSGRAVPCVGASTHVVVPKILSRHCPCGFCTFVQPVCPMLPRAFVRVVHPRKPQISFGPCTDGNPKFRSGGLGRVVCGCPCKRVRASPVRSGRAVPCVGAREHVAMQKMLRRDHPCASCTFVRPVCATLCRAFVRVVHPWKPQISFGRVGSCRAWVLGHTWQCQKC